MISTSGSVLMNEGVTAKPVVTQRDLEFWSASSEEDSGFTGDRGEGPGA